MPVSAINVEFHSIIDVVIITIIYKHIKYNISKNKFEKSFSRKNVSRIIIGGLRKNVLEIIIDAFQ